MAAVDEVLLRLMRRHGYRRMVTPAVERLDVLRGVLSDEALEQTFHLIDPEVGTPLVLRPDITPQVARFLALHPPTAGGPVRIAYSGRVHRVERNNDLAPRERHQTGAELVGWTGVDADVEILDLAIGCLRAALADARFVVAIGDARVLDALIGALGLPSAASRERIVRALARKAFDDVVRRVHEGGGDAALAERFADLSGGLDELDGWLDQPWPNPVERALKRLGKRVDRLRAHRDADRLLLDLTEVRDRRYYTGIVFEAFAGGSGQPVLAGGRYDGLLRRLGLDVPAAGFAMDRNALELAGAGSAPGPILRVSPATSRSHKAAHRLLDVLRSAGYDAAWWPSSVPNEQVWRVTVRGRRVRWRLSAGEEREGTTAQLLAALSKELASP